MMALPLSEAIKRIDAARLPVDLFTSDPTVAKRTYRTLARLVHPDHVAGTEAARAQIAFAKLAALYAANTNATVATPTAAPVPPTPLPIVTIKTKVRTYTTVERFAEGDLASLLLVDFEEDGDTSAGILKIARDSGNEDLLAAEAAALRAFARYGQPAYNAFFSELLDTLRYRDNVTGAERAANVLRDLPGFVSLTEVMAAYPTGLDARDVAWMWRRLLTALGAAHQAGVVHGAVTPEHVLIEPVEHGLVLVDWCYSVQADASTGVFPPLAAIVPARSALYPPEILAHEPASPASDIFMATKTMELLLDASAPRAIRAFTRGCIQERAIDRPDDAWSLLHELDGLLVRLYGPHRFRPFTLPGRNPAI